MKIASHVDGAMIPTLKDQARAMVHLEMNMRSWDNQFMGAWESRKFRNEKVGAAYLGKENKTSDNMMGKNGTDDDHTFKNEKLEINEEGKDHKVIEESLDAANKNNGTDGGKE